MNNATRVLMLAGIVLCLLQIWLPAYYLTSDGPCHLYNAQLVHDFWAGRNTGFYERFYTLVYRPNPNWMSTIILAALMYAVKGVVAEKIFLSWYVILYVGGFHLLYRKIASGRSLWPLVIFLFIFPHVLTKGFYNFSFSLAFFCWVVWSWLQFLEKKTIGRALLFFLFSGLIFFSHLLAFAFALVTCAALVVSYSVTLPGTKHQRIGYLANRAGLLALLAAPFVVLMLWFTHKEGGMQLLHFRPHLYRIIELLQGKHLVSFNHSELVLTTISASAIVLLLLFCLVKFKSFPVVHKYDGLLWALAFALVVYLIFPEDILGRSMDMSVRTQLFVLLLMACCIAYRLPMWQPANIGAVVVFACFLVLSGSRLYCSVAASGAQMEIMSVSKILKPNSVILPINCDPAGKDERGRPIADWNFSFRHSMQYLALEKPLIFLDNYEANMGYFPVQWKDETNPYYRLGRDEENLEGCPPSADIDAYRQTSGVTIDYVLMWCFDSSFLANDHFRALYKQVNAGYHIVYASPTKRTLLYGRN
jgi:hypothetical protein